VVECPRRSDACALSAAMRERQEKIRDQERRRFLLAVGVGERYWDVKRNGIREGAQTICRYLDDIPQHLEAGHGLLLLGPTGTGKTGALALVAAACHDRLRLSAREVRYETGTRLMRLLLDRKASVDDESCDRDDHGYPAWRVLLLDEFGSAYEHDYAFAALDDYLGWRYDQKLTTCVATNLDPAALKSSPNYERLVDRWRETCVVLTMGGQSRRQA
jgi:DNA replication protein DnaC